MVRRAKKENPWLREIGWASTICEPLGCEVAEADLSKYEIAKIKGDGVSLVIYPHTTSARNQHARVRDNGSKDKRKAALIMRAMDHGIGLSEADALHVRLSCTFSQKNYSPLWDDLPKLQAAIIDLQSREATHG
jgi:hypothetical protein